MIATIETHVPDIIRLCEEYGISRLELFGSAVTGEFNPETSDFDFLVEYPQGYDYGPWGSRPEDFKEELEQLLGRKVDLVVFKNIRNPYVAKSIERTQRSAIFETEVVFFSLGYARCVILDPRRSQRNVT
jgi:predicted nucleotidyltransferase